MAIALFPRLKDAHVDAFLTTLILDDGYDLEKSLKNLSASTSIATSGGSKIDFTKLKSLASSIKKIAIANGFPLNLSNSNKSEFDAQTAIFLSDYTDLDSGEGLRNDVWAFIASVLLPDVVKWRFPPSSSENSFLEDIIVDNQKLKKNARYKGGIRNAFQRLWIRSKLFDRGALNPNRWELLFTLTEDAMVQITERPSIAALPSLSLAIAEEWLKTSQLPVSKNMASTMRRSMVSIRRNNEICLLASLNQEKLAVRLKKHFSDSTVTL